MSVAAADERHRDSDRLPHTSEALRLAIVAVLALGLACAVGIGTGRIELSSLITPGGLGPSADVIAADFGRSVVDPDKTGYDGQQVYAIARDFPDLVAASENLDAPAYRLLRILPPALASVAPPGDATVVALLALNVLGFGVATYAGARLLERVGARPLFALPAVSVLLLGVASTTVGPVAWGLTLLGVHLALDRRHAVALLVLGLAALSRETAAAAAAGIGAGLVLQRTPLRRGVLYVVPGVVVVTWYLVVQQLVGGTLPTRFDPFAFTRLPATHASIAAVVAALGLLAAIVWRDEPAVALPALGFTLWMAVYTTDVLDPIALLRVNALPIIVGVLAIGRLASRDSASGPVQLVPDVLGHRVR